MSDDTSRHVRVSHLYDELLLACLRSRSRRKDVWIYKNTHGYSKKLLNWHTETHNVNNKFAHPETTYVTYRLVYHW